MTAQRLAHLRALITRTTALYTISGRRNPKRRPVSLARQHRQTDQHTSTTETSEATTSERTERTSEGTEKGTTERSV